MLLTFADRNKIMVAADSNY